MLSISRPGSSSHWILISILHNLEGPQMGRAVWSSFALLFRFVNKFKKFEIKPCWAGRLSLIEVTVSINDVLSHSLTLRKQYYFLYSHILGKHLIVTSSDSLPCSMALLRIHLLRPQLQSAFPPMKSCSFCCRSYTAHNICDCSLAFGIHVLSCHLVCNSLGGQRSACSVCISNYWWAGLFLLFSM